MALDCDVLPLVFFESPIGAAFAEKGIAVIYDGLFGHLVQYVVWPDVMYVDELEHLQRVAMTIDDDLKNVAVKAFAQEFSPFDAQLLAL